MEQFYNSMWQIQNVTLREDNGEQTMKGHLQKKKWDEGERKKNLHQYIMVAITIPNENEF